MSQVFIKKINPKTTVKDYQNLIKNFSRQLLPAKPIILKLNLSWTKFYPACSSPPWQVEGIIKSLLSLGFQPKQIIPVENKTVVTDVYQGAKNHFWDKICHQYGIKIHYLTQEKYIKYRPKAKMLVLDKIFPQGIFLPQIIFNKPLISLCTLKTHVFTKTTGAIKNYFGMLNTNRHWAHRYIHEAIIDLLQIQKEIHPQILALMDGAAIGYGAGPRAMEWKESNLILGSTDEVALDTTASKIIGLNPKKIKYLNLGKKLNLGENDLEKIKIKGVKKLPYFHLNQKVPKETFASRGQKLIYHHCPLWLEKFLLQTFITPWSYLASRIYYDFYWYNFYGKKRLKKFFESPWGQLFKSYSPEIASLKT